MAMTERVPPKPPAIGFLDRAILAVAPEWGARRIATRRMFAYSESSYARIESAEHDNTRGWRWLISRLSPDSQLEQDLQTTRDRSRDIYQNDALGGAIDGKVNHVIGTGHTPQGRIKEREGVVTAEDANRYNKQLEAVHEEWSPHADRTGRRSLWMCSRLAGRHNEFDGESFTVMSDVGRAYKPIPLALQVIDTERVNTPSEFAGDRLVRMGIRYSEDGDILGYYVQQSHPGDTKDVRLKYDFIPADRMLHVFEPWFAGQSRGLPWMTRALNRARDAKDYDEAAILGAQVEQCFAGFIKPAMGTGFKSAKAAASSTNSAGRRMQDITPGTMTHLDPGEEVEFGSPSRPGSNFGPFMEWNYRRVAAAINWPYEMVVKNWDGLSFAAGRLVLTDAKKATDVAQKIMREMWLCQVWQRMVYEAVTLGEVGIAPHLYLEFPAVFNRHTWLPPKWEYALNPGEDLDADVTAMEQNLATHEDTLAKHGYGDFEDFIIRRQREAERLAEAGLTAVPRISMPAQRPPAPRDPRDATRDPIADLVEDPEFEEVAA